MLIGAVVALAAALSSTVPGAATPVPRSAASRPFAPDRVLVKMQPQASIAAASRAARARSSKPLRGLPGWHLLSLPRGADVVSAARMLARVPGVTASEPDYIASAADAPDDPCIDQACPTVSQWNLYAVGAPLAWEAYPGSPQTSTQRIADPTHVFVAVLDTTIDTDHPDWANAGGSSPDSTRGGQIDLADAESWVPDGKVAGTAAYHGTFVAGIIAAAAGNGIDIAGVGYSSIVVPLAVLDGSGKTDAASLAEAIAYARNAGAKVINMSLGMEADSQTVHDAIIAATTEPGAALIVAAAGNNTKDTPFYPGSYPEVMSVSGFDSARHLAPCSNYNANVAVSAPARSVMSLAPMPGRHKMIDCGTSAAAPHVAGVASMLFGQNPARTAAQVRDIIQRTADDDDQTPGRDVRFGFGMLNADRALHDGIGPVVTKVAATLAKRGDSSSTVTAVATSALPITSAEAYLDKPGNPSARIALEPADGAWGGTTENLTATLSMPDGSPDESHLVYVRAKDTQWGAAERGRLGVDRTPPQISNVRASNSILGQKATVSFTIADAFSMDFVYSVTVTAPDGQTAYASPTVHTARGSQGVYWTPPITALPGSYGVDIFVWDEAGNPAAASASSIVV